MALIVADNVSANNETVTVYDLDDVNCPAWMVFQAVGSLTWPVSAATAVNIDSLYALNGRMYIGSNYSLIEYNFVGDDIRLGEVNPYYLKSGRTIASRNAASSYQAGGDGYAMVNANVNDVSATVLEGAEIGSMGLPIPTVAVATGAGSGDRGVSVIHPNGSVYDIKLTGAYASNVSFDEDGKLFVIQGDSYPARFDPSTLFEDRSTTYLNNFANAGTIVTTYSATPTHLGSTTSIESMGKDFATGSTTGLSLFKTNNGNFSESAVSYAASNYATGYMVGDICLATATCSTSDLSGGTFDDRSVKGNDLNVTGTLQRTAVATGAEQTALSDFSASTNYLGQNAHKTDWDFGTGDFSITCWAKWTANGTSSQYIIDRGSAGAERFYLYDASSGGKPVFYVTDDASGGGSDSSITTANDYDDGNWHQIVAVRRSSKLSIYVDGVDAQTTHVSSSQDLDNSSGYLRVGVSYVNDLPFNGSLALLRLSATAPTPQQIKEIYEAEKVLFQANAKCTLDGNSINDLAYDKSSGLLYVCNSGGSNIMRGLEYIEELTRNGTYGFASGGTIDLMTAAGGVHAASRTTLGVGANLPALDVRAELNDGEDKTPDNRKLHFEAVTTDATPTAIGHIPVAENEHVTLKVKYVGQQYNDQDGEYIFVDEVRTFYRDAGGNLAARTRSYLFEDTSTSTMYGHSSFSGSNTFLQVQGKAATRMVWKAEVEVQRVSEKRYER